MEAAKKAAGERVVDELVRSGQVLGIGSGSTIVYAVLRLAERASGPDALSVVCVPTSFQARELIVQYNLPLSDLDRHPVLDLAIDGADEVDSELNLIKGGGGCHTQEKLVAANARQLAIVADESKISQALGEKWKRGVPVEVLPGARTVVARHLRAAAGASSAELRMCGAGAGKAGPVVTDNGNFILDVVFPAPFTGKTEQLAKLDTLIRSIPGVVETGLFVDMARIVYVGKQDGSVAVLKKK